MLARHLGEQDLDRLHREELPPSRPHHRGYILARCRRRIESATQPGTHARRIGRLELPGRGTRSIVTDPPAVEADDRDELDRRPREENLPGAAHARHREPLLARTEPEPARQLENDGAGD